MDKKDKSGIAAKHRLGIWCDKLNVTCIHCMFSTKLVPFTRTDQMILQFYYIPPLLLKRIKQIGTLKDPIFDTRGLFDGSFLRLTCFSCLSSVTFSLKDLPLHQGRIRINKCGEQRIRLSDLILHANFRVLNFVYQNVVSIFPKDLPAFEYYHMKNLDAQYKMPDKILPIQVMTKLFISFAKMKLPRPSLYLDPMWKNSDSHREYIPMTKEEMYLHTRQGTGCKRSGHVLHKTFSDFKRKCLYCPMIFPINKKSCIDRIRTLTDDFKYTGRLIEYSYYQTYKL